MNNQDNTMSRICVYVDKNIISLSNNNEHSEQLQKFLSLEGLQFVVAEPFLKECNEEELSFLKSKSFGLLQINRNDQSESGFLGNLPDDLTGYSPIATGFEKAFLEIQQAMVNPNFQHDLLRQMSSGITEAMNSVWEVASEIENDPEISRNLRAELKNQFGRISDSAENVSSEIFTSEIGELHSEGMEVAGFGAAKLNNLKPPGIIKKLLSRFPTESDEIVNLFSNETGHQIKIEQIETAVCWLAFVGLWPDKKMKNRSKSKSFGSVSAQNRDAQHISHAAYCSVFLTADKRAACLAYAVYEELKIGTKVIFFKTKENRMFMLGESYWPWQ